MTDAGELVPFRDDSGKSHIVLEFNKSGALDGLIQNEHACNVCIISFVNMNPNVLHRPAAAAALFDRYGTNDDASQYYNFS